MLVLGFTFQNNRKINYSHKRWYSASSWKRTSTCFFLSRQGTQFHIIYL